MMCVCVCFAGAGPSDTPQPGSVEHGHEAVWGFREAGLLAAAALLPARHLWKPAAALLQTRGTQRCYGLLNPGGPRLDTLGLTAKMDNCSDSPSNVFCWYYITITVVLLSTVWSKNNRNIHLNIEKRGHQNLYSVLQQTETPFTRALTYLAAPCNNHVYTRVVIVVILDWAGLHDSVHPMELSSLESYCGVFHQKHATLCYMRDCVSIFHQPEHHRGSTQGVTIFWKEFGVMWCESQWKELKTHTESCREATVFH